MARRRLASRGTSSLSVCVQEAAALQKKRPSNERFCDSLEAFGSSPFIDKLNGVLRPTEERFFAHCKQEYEELRAMFATCIEQRRADSCLLLGPKNCGKTTLTDAVLEGLRRSGHAFKTVRLNGVLHADDRVAMARVVESMNLAADLSDEDLSEEDLSEEDAEADFEADEIEKKNAKTTSLSKAFATFVDACSRRNSEPVFVLIDGFETFAARSKQALLYALFSVCHANAAPLVVVGESARFDCADLLEKRVKSRFSHRIVVHRGFGTLRVFAHESVDWLFADGPPIGAVAKLKVAAEEALADDRSPFAAFCRAEFDGGRNVKALFGVLAEAAVALMTTRDGEAAAGSVLEACSRDRLETTALVAALRELSPTQAALLALVRAGGGVCPLQRVIAEHKRFVLATEGALPAAAAVVHAIDGLVAAGIVGWTRVAGATNKNSTVPREQRTVQLLVAGGTSVDEFVGMVAQNCVFPAALRKWLVQ